MQSVEVLFVVLVFAVLIFYPKVTADLMNAEFTSQVITNFILFQLSRKTVLKLVTMYDT